jgi:ubiquinol-cytochrome c reductase iron-sulfur subunit
MKQDDKSSGGFSEQRAEGASDGSSEPSHRVDAASEKQQGGKRSTLVMTAALGWATLKSLGNIFLGYMPARLKTMAVEEATQEEGRAGDRDEDCENGVDLARRERWGTLFVSLAFGVCIAAGLGFLFIYWSGGNNLLLGGMLALCLAGIGSALVLWAHWLTRHKQATEQREQLASSLAERTSLITEYEAGVRDVHRRGLLKWIGAAAAGMLASIVISLIRSLSGAPGDALYTTVWKRGQRLMTEDGKPITVHSLQPEGTITVFPENSIGSEKSQTVLIRVREDLLQLPKDRANWAPNGYLAFSRICTHAGCPVGLYQSETHLLLCPCHQSTFNVLQSAVPTGGPATRSLPQLPLYVDSDGTLRASGGFSEPPGPGFWGMP